MEGFEIVNLEDVDLNEELPDDKTENSKQLKMSLFVFKICRY